MLRLGADTIVSQQSTEPTWYRPWPFFLFPSLFRSESNQLKSLATHAYAQLKSFCWRAQALLKFSSAWEHLRASCLGCATFSQVPKVLDPEAEKKPDTEKHAITCHHVSSRVIGLVGSACWWKWKPKSVSLFQGHFWRYTVCAWCGCCAKAERRAESCSGKAG